MKYFTPDILLRARSTDDDVADAAHAEWEEKSQQYLERISTLRLPKGARLLSRRLSLHDARVLMVGARKDGLTISFFLKTVDGEGVGLLYELAAPPRILRHPGLAEPCPVEWLYDEFDREDVSGRNVLTHSILLTDGTEIQLAFYDLHVKKFGTFVLPSQEAGLEELLVG